MRWAATVGFYGGVLVVAGGLAAWLLGGERHEPERARRAQSAAPPGSSAPPLRATPPPAAPAPRFVAEAAEGICPREMLLVRGDYCPRFRDCDGPACVPVCAVDAPRLAFCIDRYEYPNLEGVSPAVMVSVEEARSACSVEGKRMCRDIEWSFACAGVGREPGVPEGCNLTHSIRWPAPEQAWIARKVPSLLSQVDRRARNSSESACESPFGALNMLGNVQEWVDSTLEGWAAFKGGHYGSPSARCSESKNTKTPGTRYLHTGFRCCADLRLGSR